MLLTLPLFSREGKMLESTAAALFSTEVSAEEKDAERGDSSMQSHIISGTPPAVHPIV